VTISLSYVLTALCTLLIPVGLLLYALYNAVHFGEANAFSKAQAA